MSVAISTTEGRKKKKRTNADLGLEAKTPPERKGKRGSWEQFGEHRPKADRKKKRRPGKKTDPSASQQERATVSDSKRVRRPTRRFKREKKKRKGKELITSRR